MTDNTEGWEAEFDEKFNYPYRLEVVGDWQDNVNMTAVKAFIKEKLQEAEERALRKYHIYKILPGKDYVDCGPAIMEARKQERGEWEKKYNL